MHYIFADETKKTTVTNAYSVYSSQKTKALVASHRGVRHRNGIAAQRRRFPKLSQFPAAACIILPEIGSASSAPPTSNQDYCLQPAY